jgi:lysophospholipase L1-like esterase
MSGGRIVLVGAVVAIAGVGGLCVPWSRLSSAFLSIPQSGTSIALKSANVTLPGDSVPPGSPNGKEHEDSQSKPNSDVKIGTAAPVVNADENGSAEGTDPGLVVLHIGDSHTSADFFTGELRRRLQDRFGQKGVGYTTAGQPHTGVRSSALKITTSSGWSYRSLQKRDAHPEKFWLSGYGAIATAPGETMVFASEQPISFDAVEIETVSQPAGGAIDIAIDDRVEKHFDLESSRTEPIAIRIPARGPGAELREVSITTTGQGETLIASISISKSGKGLTYSSVGYVGATVDVLNKLPEKMLSRDLMQIRPQIVILSFGTNEAANDGLDLASYRASYELVVKKIKSYLPDAVLVMILPPDFNLLPSECPKDNASAATCTGESRNVAASNSTTLPAEKLQCSWRTPAKLAEVRKTQREIAEQYSLIYWDWSSIMPSECGAHQWYTASPPLMSRDHVHFTPMGYKRSAELFLDTLLPIINKVRAQQRMVATKYSSR